MDKLQLVFREESEDLLLNLEQSLLSLEKNTDDENRIDEVFRAMHTLKGNSSMFGFFKISDFVHNLETLYSLIRDKKIEATKKIIDCTFDVLDLLKLLVKDPIVTEEGNLKKLADLSNRIISFLETIETGKQQIKKPNIQPEATSDISEEEHKEKTYYIYFNPVKEIFEDGTNPLYLIEELTSLGRAKVFTYVQLPEKIEDFNVESCYSSWVILLSTEVSANEIKDVFLFVEDAAEIVVELLFQQNLLSNKQFMSSLNYKGLSSEVIKLETVKELVSTLNLQETEPEVTVPEVQKMEEEVEPQILNIPTVTHTKEKTISSVRVGSDKLDDLMNLVSELITTQAGLTHYMEDNHTLALESISENVEKLSRQLRDIAFSMTLIPFNSLFSRFQRMIRDVSSNLDKNVEFVTQGGETELDKTIIEKLTDPLLHLLRNSLDHGIESPEERKANGKPEKGTITLKAYYSGVNVYIEIQDDGRGIDPVLIMGAAVRKGLIQENTELSKTEIFNLLFAPGFSTAKKVTDVSGRGVGMDVVKRNIADIRGEISIDSVLGKGSTFKMKLPLTLSITDGLLVKIADIFYLIPLSVVSKCYEVKRKDLKNNLNRVIILEGEQVPFLHLRDEFGIEDKAPEFFQLIVVENEGKKVGLTADVILGEYQAVLKPLGKYYRNQDFISGGTILGDGTIALVMDTSKIINQFSKVKKEELV